MSEVPNALRLAECLDNITFLTRKQAEDAAAELRRLYARAQELEYMHARVQELEAERAAIIAEKDEYKVWFRAARAELEASQAQCVPQIDWESAAEKIAIAVADNCGTVQKLFAGHTTQQGLDARDAAFEAVRKAFCKLQRYSFFLDGAGNVRRCADHCGNWVEFEAVHTLFEPQSVDTAIAAQAKQGGAAAEIGKAMQ